MSRLEALDELVKSFEERRNLIEATTFTMANADRHDQERSYLQGLFNDEGCNHFTIQTVRLFETQRVYQLCFWVCINSNETRDEIFNISEKIFFKFKETKLKIFDKIAIKMYYSSETYKGFGCGFHDRKNRNEQNSPREPVPNFPSFEEISSIADSS